MNNQEAREIADLLNRRNQLSRVHTENDILQDADNYLFKSVDDHVIAAVEVKHVQWYQAELCHLTVAEGHEGRGHGREMAACAEKRALESGTRIIQCTIREGNGDSERLVRAAGYCRVSTFYNARSKNSVAVWQKVLVTKPQ